MKSEIVNVTPQKAAEWLSLNVENRPLRRTVVEGLKAAFARGEYIQTHQGIAFSAQGNLLDGQHRLTAISEMRGVSFPMLVSHGVDDHAFQVMDIGLKRSHADALRIDDRRVVEVARLIAVICSAKRQAVTPLMLVPIIDAIQPTHDALISFCASSVKAWSSAAVRVAAVTSMLSGGDADYIKTTYRALVLSDFDSMPPVARALYRAYVNGTVSASDRNDMVARCLVVFNQKKAANSKVQIKDNSEAIAFVRSQFLHLIEPDAAAPKKMTAKETAAKSVLQGHSSDKRRGSAEHRLWQGASRA